MGSRWRRVIAALEIVGGVVGPLLVIGELGQRRPTVADLLVGATLIALYMTSLLAGVLLWRGTRLGRVLSVVVQCIQLPKVLSPQFAFMARFGFDIALLATTRPGQSWVGFDLSPGAKGRLLFNAAEMPVGFGLSLLSCAWLWLLLGLGRLPTEAASPVPPEPNNAPDATAVAAFLEATKAVRQAKREAEPGAAPDTAM